MVLIYPCKSPGPVYSDRFMGWFRNRLFLRAYLMGSSSTVVVSTCITRRVILPLYPYSKWSQMLLVKQQAPPGQGMGCVLWFT